MSPPLKPDADEARRMLEQELAKPEYLDPQGWLQDLWNRLLDWLTGGRAIPVMSDAQATAVVVGLGLMVVAAGLLVWWRLGPVRASARRHAEAFLADEHRTAGELRADAARLAAADQWGQATLQTFRAMIRALDERAIIEPSPGLTADEAAARASERLPQVAGRLVAAAGVFDGLAYGGLAGSAGQYREMQALDAAVADLRPTLPEAAADPDAVSVEVAGMKRPWLIGAGVLLALFLTLAAVTVLVPVPSEQLNGSLTNARPNGTRALGQVLQANGVAVTQVVSLEDAASAPAGSTLAIYLDKDMSEAAATRLSESAADLVILVTSDQSDALSILSDERMGTAWWGLSSETVTADCDDIDALGPGTITSSLQGVESYSDDVTLCFTSTDGIALYADTRTSRHRVTVIGGAGWLRNDTITKAGNAALGLRVLGRQQRLTWYLPGDDILTTDPSQQPDMFSLLPGWMKEVIAIALLAGAAAALWRGRRFGALVRERLPVAVPASEAAAGLGRLYRQSAARGHAAASLRAATLRRLGTRMGLPPSAVPDLVVERLTEATGRPPDRLWHLCYGPAPATDADLLDLAAQLSDLERELTAHE